MAELKTEEILRAEANAIHGRGPTTGDTGTKLYRALNELKSAALCLSGGGIRSAAFALGVIQAFATHPRSDPSVAAPTDSADKSLLTKFHYLSTVSGGGYIGSWLSAWRMEKPFPEIWARLVTRPQGPDFEPPTIGWLRSYSNYLTPKTGVLSTDTWTAVALSIRNLLLNWLVIFPPICAAILLLKIAAVGSDWLTRFDLGNSWWKWKTGFEIACGVSGAVSLMIALAFTTHYRPSRRTSQASGPSQIRFLCTTMLFSLMSAVLLIQFLASDLIGLSLLQCNGVRTPVWILSICDQENLIKIGQLTKVFDGNELDPRFLKPLDPAYAYPVIGALCGAFIYAMGYAIGSVAGRLRRLDFLDLASWTTSGAVYGALFGVAFHFYLEIPEAGVGPFASVVLHLVFGVPWLLTSQLLAEMIFAGLSSYQEQSEADREWLGRAAGWFLTVGLTWLAVAFLIYFAAVFKGLKDQLSDPAVLNSMKLLISSVACISGAITAILGKSSLLTAKGESKGVWSYVMSNILPITAALFAAAILIIISYLIDQLLLGRSLVPELFESWTLENRSPDWPDRIESSIWLLVGFLIASGIGVCASWCININRFLVARALSESARACVPRRTSKKKSGSVHRLRSARQSKNASTVVTGRIRKLAAIPHYQHSA